MQGLEDSVILCFANGGNWGSNQSESRSVTFQKLPAGCSILEEQFSRELEKSPDSVAWQVPAQPASSLCFRLSPSCTQWPVAGSPIASYLYACCPFSLESSPASSHTASTHSPITHSSPEAARPPVWLHCWLLQHLATRWHLHALMCQAIPPPPNITYMKHLKDSILFNLSLCFQDRPHRTDAH